MVRRFDLTETFIDQKSLAQSHVLLNVPIICLVVSARFVNKNYSLFIHIFVELAF